MPAKLTPIETEAIRASKDRTHVLAARHGVSVSRIKEIRAEVGRSRADDSGGRPVGQPKTGGRLAGTPNKRTVYARQILDQYGSDPVEMLAKTMADEGNVPLDIRIDCAKALLPYVYPKLSSVEVSGPNGDAVRVEHDQTLCELMMKDDLIVARMETLVIEMTEPARRERESFGPAYKPELG